MDRLTPLPCQKTMNNKQGTEKGHAAEGTGLFRKLTGEGGRVKALISAEHSVNKDWKGKTEGPTVGR
jgi:hypothetical protein